MGETDTISRQAAIDAVDVLCQEHRYRIPGKRETYSQYNEAWQDALDRAEVAIGNLPSVRPATNCSEIPNGSADTISRQAAIDVALEDVSDKRTHEFNAGAIRAANRIKSLPSAQPQSITCDGCKHVGTYDTDFPCSSCIRREKDYYEPDE